VILSQYQRKQDQHGLPVVRIVTIIVNISLKKSKFISRKLKLRRKNSSIRLDPLIVIERLLKKKNIQKLKVDILKKKKIKKFSMVKIFSQKK